VWIGDEQQECGPGMVIWVPAGCRHRIVNSGADPLVLVVGIAPSHKD
jgi:mannose-6-phosphate isomerase-like protein (cupin superfamily)